MTENRVTKSGRVVHARTSDHSTDSRFNKKVGLAITKVVGTMWAAYVFTGIAFLSLPSILAQVFPELKPDFPRWTMSASLISLVLWVSSEFMQLVLLPIIIVGQNAQSEAGDARNEKGFEDTERILDRLDLSTEGGLTTLYEEIRAIHGKLDGKAPDG